MSENVIGIILILSGHNGVFRYFYTLQEYFLSSIVGYRASIAVSESLLDLEIHKIDAFELLILIVSTNRINPREGDRAEYCR